MKEKPKFIMVVGLPGSGKSYFLEENFSNYNIHSSDKIRAELLSGESDQSNNSLVFETLHERVKNDLKNGISCCYDAVNQNSKRRKAFLQEIKNIPCYKECCIVATPFEFCIQNDLTRNRNVGKSVIEKFHRSFNIPTEREGWDSIKLVYNFDGFCYYNGESILERLSKISQNNPHHTETIGNHCLLCKENVLKDYRLEYLNDYQKEIIINAATYHDIGKEFTATFENKKGEITDVCHYYDHENIGAYNSLFLDCHEEKSAKQILDTADIIQLHMKLYSNPESEKYKAKLRRQLGDNLYNLLEILNDADKNAK